MNEVTDIGLDDNERIMYTLAKLDESAQKLLVELRGINGNLAEAIKLLREAPVLRAQVAGAPGIPLIGGK